MKSVDTNTVGASQLQVDLHGGKGTGSLDARRSLQTNFSGRCKRRVLWLTSCRLGRVSAVLVGTAYRGLEAG
jgi:hypothetical protein